MTILIGDALETLKTLDASSVQCCVTSPPYYGLRDYGVAGQMGLEQSPDDYIAAMVLVFREVRRVLRDDGTLWLNLGDSYAGSRMGAQGKTGERNGSHTENGLVKGSGDLKNKDRMMIPARVALALQADGWYLRDEVVWHKPRTTPFPANDRTVAAHEMVYLLTKKPRYFYDWAAIEEPSSYPGLVRKAGKAFRKRGADKAALISGTADKADTGNSQGVDFMVRETRRKRSVWSISPTPYSGAHFATMPIGLADICIRAGSRPGDAVLDPFGGSGTTGVAAERLGRDHLLIELNPEYAMMADTRIDDEIIKKALGQ